MTRLLLSLLVIFSYAHLKAQTVIYSPSDSLRVVELLSKAPSLTSTNEYMSHFARQLLGTPYVAQTLEKGPTEHLVVNLHQMDCTTFVETVLALSLTARDGEHTWDAYTDCLRLIRYDHGRVAYDSRLHYFSAWIESNTLKGFISEGSQDSLPSIFEEKQTLSTNYMSTHPSEYPSLKNDTAMVSLIRDMERELSGRQYRYIPKRLLQRGTKSLKRYISNGDIIAIVTSKAGLDISHVGIASWHSDGTLHLINASQTDKKVVDSPMTLYNYMTSHPSQIGIRVVHLK